MTKLLLKLEHMIKTQENEEEGDDEETKRMKQIVKDIENEKSLIDEEVKNQMCNTPERKTRLEADRRAAVQVIMEKYLKQAGYEKPEPELEIGLSEVGDANVDIF